MAKKDPKTRGQVYKELFEESNSINSEVSSYLLAFLIQVLPEFFFKGSNKNRKVLNKKICQFIDFNRYETLNVQNRPG